MLSMKQLFFLSVIMLSIGCTKKHKSTTKICGGLLYVESFNVNPVGVDEDYLTDSLTFRLYVGKFDNEHENFSYICNCDTIRIMKRVMVTYGNKMKTIDEKLLSLTDLRNKKKSNSQPLFEFK